MLIVHLRVSCRLANNRGRLESLDCDIKDLNADDPKLDEFMSKYKEEHNIGFADITDIVKHIDHVVNLIGIDHVGIGSDFDGVGDSLPTGMKDVSMYPNLIHELLKKGYSREDIVKICSGNVFRVWSEVEATAKRLQTSS